MVRLPQAVLVGVTSALLLATVSSANAENRHGMLPSRQMYMHAPRHRMHMMRPPMMHGYMHHYHHHYHHHYMMHHNAM